MNEQQALTHGDGGDQAAFGRLDGPTHLPSRTVRERERAMAQLREWVPQLVRRFAIDSRVIPPCWEKHNGIVEALQALRDHERASYADTAPLTGAVEWFLAFREIEVRLTSLGASTHCTRQEHRSAPIQDWALNDSQ